MRKDGRPSFLFDTDEYDRNEAIFFRLLFSSIKNQTKYGIPYHPFTKVMDNVFGKNPNKKNQQELFKNEIIIKLWCGAEHSQVKGFKNSKAIKDIIA